MGIGASASVLGGRQRVILGEGGYGKVHKEGKQAVKVVKCDSHEALEGVEHEFLVMRAGSRRCVNIMRADSIDFDPSSQLAEIRMPLCEGSLRDLVARHQEQQRRECGLPEVLVLQVLKQSLVALKELHALGWSHGDVKPDNILVTRFPGLGMEGTLEEGAVKLADFGLSFSVEHKHVFQGRVGTQGYLAPEIESLGDTGIPLQHGFGQKADMWSLGITLMELLLGHYPETYADIDITDHGEQWRHISKQTRWIISFLLRDDPCARPDAEMLLHFLEKHPLLLALGAQGSLNQELEGRGHPRKDETRARTIVPELVQIALRLLHAGRVSPC